MEGCHDGGSDGCDGGGVTVVMAAMVWVIGSLLESAGVHQTSSGWTPVESAGVCRSPTGLCGEEIRTWSRRR